MLRMEKFVTIATAICLLMVTASSFKTENDANDTPVHRSRRSPNVHSWRLTALANKFFAHRLFSAVSRTTAMNENIFISPYAVSAGLSLTLYGARDRTAQQIMSTLGYSLLPNDFEENRVPRLYKKMLNQLMRPEHGFTLVSANRMFGDRSQRFSSEFVRGAEEYYGAPLMKVDFQGNAEGARRTINQWVASVTNNTIDEAMPLGTITASTVLALVSTLYFSGQWEMPFPSTTRSMFTTTDGGKYETEFMRGKMMVKYAEAEDLQALWVEIPYRTTSRKYKIVMELLLPYKKTEAALFALERSLTEDALHYSTMDRQHSPMEITLPKFRLKYGRDLRETLYSMGIKDLFTAGTADLSGINNDLNLSLGTAEHTTFLEVNQQGTTAGASFGQVLAKRAHSVEFTHPFIIIIREKYTKMPLFMGRIARP